MHCCFCEEYHNPLNNQYYHLLGKKIGIKDRKIKESANWYAVPTIGCLTAGYMLLVCKQHYQSLANLNIDLYHEMLTLKSHIETIILEKLKRPCIAFEHGSTDSNYSGANSVEHVHLHILPYPEIIWDNLHQKYHLTNFEIVSNYEELYQKWQINPPKSYLFFQDINNNIYYNPNAERMPSQFFRKCMASYYKSDQWDWQKEYYVENFLQTLECFQLPITNS